MPSTAAAENQCDTIRLEGCEGMSLPRESLFEAFLNQHDRATWTSALASMRGDIHEVDRVATWIWFQFFPMDLARVFESSDEPAQLTRQLLIQGDHRLKDQLDASHRFLWGHRYWPRVKAAVLEHATTPTAPVSLDLATVIRAVGRKVAAAANVPEALVLGISAVGLMTLQQVGLETFKSTPGEVEIPRHLARATPDEIVRQRARDDGQGLLGFLRGIRSEYTVIFDENDVSARFRLVNSQHLATAAAADTRDHRSRDPRCQEGPIPVQCRTASCGTCWVGVLGGAQKLSDVDPLERRRIREFGYIDTDESKPFIRRACMAQASGNVTIVIPPWNGVFGKFLRASADRVRSPHARPTAR
jgi:ferredoxin